MSDKKNEFVHETIKEKPINKKRIGLKLLVSAGCAVVFAGIVCLIVALALPIILEKRGYVISSKEKEGQVTEETEEPSTDTTESTEPEKVVFDISVEDYQKIRTKLYAIGKKANKSVVQITSVTNATDVFDSTYESAEIGSGVIISKNNSELLILTEYSLISGASGLHVSFIDGAEVEASVKNYDVGSGLAILSVNRAKVSDETEAKIAPINKNKKTMLTPGSVVIAIGSPQGDVYSIMVGDLISHNAELSVPDHVYNIITTNIPSYNKGTGVLLNINGDVIGVIMHDYNSDAGTNTISAIPMTQIDEMLELISAGKSVPYVGLNLTTITSQIAQENGIPLGAYVESLEDDSVVKAGTVQIGDVITQFNGETISSVASYAEALQKCKVGEEVEMVVKRKGKTDYTEMKISITIGEKK